MAVYQLGALTPKIDSSAYVHPDATVIGDVILESGSSVWPNATLRGDTEPLTVGANSNVQDGSVLHADPGCPLVIGQDVTIGHQVMLHGCAIGDGTLIGIQSVVLNKARIGKYCLVGAGSLITEGKEFPDRVMILGRPAKVIRDLTEEEVRRLALNAQVYVERARRYAVELLQVTR